MNLFLEYKKKIFKSLKALEKYKKINIPSTLKIINVDLPPRNQKADLACNAAMILARSNNTSPNLLAEKIKKHLLLNFKEFSEIEIAGPGFLNFEIDNSLCFF